MGSYYVWLIDIKTYFRCLPKVMLDVSSYLREPFEALIKRFMLDLVKTVSFFKQIKRSRSNFQLSYWIKSLKEWMTVFCANITADGDVAEIKRIISKAGNLSEGISSHLLKWTDVTQVDLNAVIL